jgi:hypothetical protein
MKKISLLLNLICFYSIGGELHNLESFSLSNFNLPNLHNLKILASEYCSQFGEVEFTVNSTSGSLYYDCKSKCCNETLRTICHRLFSQDKDYFNRVWTLKQLDEQLDEIILFQQFLSEKFFSGDIHAVSFDSSVTKNVLLKLIEEEKESIDIAIFKLTDPDIIVALKEAARKNIKVRIIVNKSTSNAYNMHDLNSFENFQVNFYESKEKEILHHK